MSLVVIETFPCRAPGTNELFEDVRFSIMSDGVYHISQDRHPLVTITDKEGSRYLLGKVVVQSILGKHVCDIHNPLEDLPVVHEINIPNNDLQNVEFFLDNQVLKIRIDTQMRKACGTVPVYDEYICVNFNAKVYFVNTDGGTERYQPLGMGRSSVVVKYSGEHPKLTKGYSKIEKLRDTARFQDSEGTFTKLTGSFIKLPEGLTKWL